MSWLVTVLGLLLATPGWTAEPLLPRDGEVSDLETGEAPVCTSSARKLCLEGGRLQVEVELAVDGGLQRAAAFADPSGTFWLDDPALPEVEVSVLDGRPVDAGYWILYGSPSGVAATLRVTDTWARSSFEARIAAGDTTTHTLPVALLAPRSVTVTLDGARSVSATVPVAGKTLTAKSANGTIFTLVIPPGALLSEATIKMTPVLSMGGLPFNPGLVAAVHLEPEGLRLFQAATLRIKPPAAVPRAQEMTFAYRGTGQEFFLFPPSVSAAGVELKLLHFSGYGVARGSLAEQTAQLLRLPTRAEDRLSQKLQSIVSKKRRGGKLAPLAPLAPLAQEDFLSDVEKTLRDAYKTSIQPNLVAVTTSCATFKKQMPMMLGWSRTVQLMGQSGFAAEVAKIFDALEKGTANCYNEAFTKCVVQHDLPQVTAMFSYLRQLQLLGAADLVDESRIDKCVRFDLNFESDLEYLSTLPNPIGAQVGLRMKLRAKVPLRFDGNFKVGGSAPLEWLSASWTGILPPDVAVNHVGPGVGSTLNVVSLATDLNLYEGPPPPPQIELTYDPGAPTVLNSYLFGDPPTPVFFPDFEWRSPYYFLHSDEAIFGLEGPLVASDWHFSGFWARRTYERGRSAPGVLNASETTVMELIHTPVQ